MLRQRLLAVPHCLPRLVAFARRGRERRVANLDGAHRRVALALALGERGVDPAERGVALLHHAPRVVALALALREEAARVGEAALHLRQPRLACARLLRRRVAGGARLARDGVAARVRSLGALQIRAQRLDVLLQVRAQQTQLAVLELDAALQLRGALLGGGDARAAGARRFRGEAAHLLQLALRLVGAARRLLRLGDGPRALGIFFESSWSRRGVLELLQRAAELRQLRLRRLEVGAHGPGALLPEVRARLGVAGLRLRLGGDAARLGLGGARGRVRVIQLPRVERGPLVRSAARGVVGGAAQVRGVGVPEPGANRNRRAAGGGAAHRAGLGAARERAVAGAPRRGRGGRGTRQRRRGGHPNGGGEATCAFRAFS